jgi:hypothetical protein
MANDTEEHFLPHRTHAESLRYLFSGGDGCRDFNRAAHDLIIGQDVLENAFTLEPVHDGPP